MIQGTEMENFDVKEIIRSSYGRSLTLSLIAHTFPLSLFSLFVSVPSSHPHFYQEVIKLYLTMLHKVTIMTSIGNV
jgi:hypothetical protein